MKTVAVITAAWRSGAWIRDCIASVQSQRVHKDITIELRIGVDGCLQTARALGTLRHPYWWSPTNVGTYIIRNSLIGTARADYYAIFDADDMMRPTYLQTLIDLVGEHGLAGAGRSTIDDKGRPVHSNSRFHSGVCLFTHSVWKTCGAYRADRIAADADLIARAKLLEVPVTAFVKPLYIRRRHESSLTRARETRFGGRVRNKIIATHAKLRAQGDLYVRPVTTPLQWRNPQLDAFGLTPMVEPVVRVSESTAPLRHSVYTRLRYSEEAKFAQRLPLLRLITAPAMAAQVNCVAPRWVFHCFDRHREAITNTVRTAGWTGPIAFNERDDTEDIQTVLDSDDWVHPTWIQDVQDQFYPGMNTEIIYWQPMRYNLRSGSWYVPRRLANWCSMFYSVYKPNNAVHVYAKKHTEMQTFHVNCHAAADNRLVALVIHGSNVYTKMRGNEIRVDAPDGITINPEAARYAL